MSSDDNSPVIYPQPDATWMADHRRKIIAAIPETVDDTMAEISRIAERMIARFASLPCVGEVAKIPACSSGFAATCPERDTPACPRRIAAFELERQVDNRRERLRAAGVPERAATLVTSPKLDDSIVAFKLVRAWLTSGQQHLVLCGPVGVGKSVAAAHALLVSGGAWISASEAGSVAIEDRDRMKRLERANLLVIDDVGTEIDKGWSIATIRKLVEGRADRMLRTLITSNLVRSSFELILEARAVDRILGDGEIVEFGGKSLRGVRP
jgi:hypothetical protein